MKIPVKLTDSSGGTSGVPTIAAIGQAGNAGSADYAATQNAVSTLAATVNSLIDVIKILTKKVEDLEHA